MRRRHRRAHRLIWRVLAVVLPLIVLAAIAARQNNPVSVAPIRLAAP